MNAPWKREVIKGLRWVDCSDQLPEDSGYYSVVTRESYFRPCVAYFDAESANWDYMPPPDALEWIVGPTCEAILEGLEQRGTAASKALAAEIERICLDEDLPALVEEMALRKLAGGYDTGATRGVRAWCMMPPPPIECDEETGSEIVQMGSYDIAEAILPHLRKAIGAAINVRGGDA